MGDADARRRQSDLRKSDLRKSDLERELGRAEYEPLLPIEKKLIGRSLGLGIALLVVPALVSRLYPAG